MPIKHTLQIQIVILAAHCPDHKSEVGRLQYFLSSVPSMYGHLSAGALKTSPFFVFQLPFFGGRGLDFSPQHDAMLEILGGPVEISSAVFHHHQEIGSVSWRLQAKLAALIHC